MVRQALASELGTVVSLRAVERSVSHLRREFAAEALATVRSDRRDADGAVLERLFERGGSRRVEVQDRLMVNDPDLAVRAAVDGLEIAHTIEGQVKPFLHPVNWSACWRIARHPSRAFCSTPAGARFRPPFLPLSRSSRSGEAQHPPIGRWRTSCRLIQTIEVGIPGKSEHASALGPFTFHPKVTYSWQVVDRGRRGPRGSGRPQ